MGRVYHILINRKTNEPDLHIIYNELWEIEVVM